MPRAKRRSRTEPAAEAREHRDRSVFLAEKIIKNYVSGLLAKLGMQRRTQAAVYGAEIRGN